MGDPAGAGSLLGGGAAFVAIIMVPIERADREQTNGGAGSLTTPKQAPKSGEIHGSPSYAVLYEYNSYRKMYDVRPLQLWHTVVEETA